MSSCICAPPVDAAAAAEPSISWPTPLALIRRLHVDMMRVCSAACRPGAAR
jgi:hypothetical protein